MSNGYKATVAHCVLACRGAALEMLLTKLIASRGKSNIQIVAMSATMSGLDSLSSWLNAHLFLTNFRPVPLTEHAVFEGRVFVKCSMQPQQLAGDTRLCRQQHLCVVRQLGGLQVLASPRPAPCTAMRQHT